MILFRRLRAWLSNQATLAALLAGREAEIRRLEHALTVAADRHDAEMANLRAMHRAEADRWTRDANHREAQIDALNRACQNTEMRLREERRLSDAAWQRVALLGGLADHPDMPPHLAEEIRTVGDRVHRIKETPR